MAEHTEPLPLDVVDALRDRHTGNPTVDAEIHALCGEIYRLRAVVSDLVRLKDGPRDDAYYAERGSVWERARNAVPS